MKEVYAKIEALTAAELQEAAEETFSATSKLIYR